MFTKGFAKTAADWARKVLSRKPGVTVLTKDLVNKAPSIDPVLKRVGSSARRYAEIGAAPAVGKNGNVVDYGRYGIKIKGK